MSSASCASDLAAWLGERVATTRIVALWVVLTATAWGTESDIALWTVAVPMALLVVQFRLWDDLSDRARDAARHPARVAVRTTHARCFAMVVAALTVSVAALLAATRGGSTLVAYGALQMAAAAFYKKSVVAARHPWRTYAVLLKYPAFVALCAGAAAPSRVVATAAAVFGVLAAFETLDDAALRVVPGRWLRTAGFALLALAGVTMIAMS